MANTSFWSLETGNPLTTASGEAIKDYFNKQSGDSTSSNMWKIDLGAQAFNTRIINVENAVSNTYQVYTTNLVWDSNVGGTDYYTGTSSLITTLEDEMMFLFYFDKTNSGSVTFKLNTLDTLALRKVDISTGNYVDMQADDIKINTPYYVQWRNGQMIFVGENVIQQIKDLDNTKEELINTASTKETIVDTDYIPLVDSADSNKTKISLWSNIKSVLKSYFDGVYVPTSRKINGKALLADVTLTASDVGARAEDWLPTLAQVGGSNENLLHNTDLTNCLNTRGQDTYTSTSDGGTPCVDRYKISGNGSSLVVTSGAVSNVTLVPNYAAFLQTLEFSPSMRGKTFTLSVDISAIAGSGNLYLRAYDGVANFGLGTPITQTGIVSVTFDVSENATQLLVFLENRSTSSNISFTPTEIKLEPGAISTLANDPPPDPQQGLLKCKRYYRMWTTEAARTEALKEVGLMRLASPTLGTISISGTTYYYADADL